MPRAQHAHAAAALGLDAWSFKLISEKRRACLEQDRSFEALLDEIVSTATVIKARIEPVERPPKVGPQKLSRAEFRIALAKPALVDEFFNGRSGLRGQYWRCAKIGDEATRLVIQALREQLVSTQPDQKLGRYGWYMQATDVAASLAVGSAKVWVAERDQQGQYLVNPDNLERVDVVRWLENEHGQKRNWRWTPAEGDLDVKGGWISPDHEEWVPEDKRDRGESVHCYGWT